jgi:hypothetical protein
MSQSSQRILVRGINHFVRTIVVNLANHDVMPPRILAFRATGVVNFGTISLLNCKTEVVGQLRSMTVIAFRRKDNLHGTILVDAYSFSRETRNIIAIEGIVVDAINQFVNVNKSLLCIAKDASVGLIAARVFDAKCKILNNHIVPKLLNACKSIILGKVGFNRRNVGTDCVRHGVLVLCKGFARTFPDSTVRGLEAVCGRLNWRSALGRPSLVKQE